MARYKDEQCRICRREGQKLFLKGDRCYTDKCSISRRNYAPVREVGDEFAASDDPKAFAKNNRFGKITDN